MNTSVASVVEVVVAKNDELTVDSVVVTVRVVLKSVMVNASGLMTVRVSV